jgi:hypothetical protein
MIMWDYFTIIIIFTSIMSITGVVVNKNMNKIKNNIRSCANAIIDAYVDIKCLMFGIKKKPQKHMTSSHKLCSVVTEPDDEGYVMYMYNNETYLVHKFRIPLQSHLDMFHNYQEIESIIVEGADSSVDEQTINKIKHAFYKIAGPLFNFHDNQPRITLLYKVDPSLISTNISKIIVNMDSCVEHILV